MRAGRRGAPRGSTSRPTCCAPTRARTGLRISTRRPSWSGRRRRWPIRTWQQPARGPIELEFLAVSV
eukprot:11313590-Alexandrium_andersonii.AAC.1